jgi:hypothetical protein
VPYAWKVDYDDYKAFSRAMRDADRDLLKAFQKELRDALKDARTDFRQGWAEAEADIGSHWNKADPIKATPTKNVVSSVSAFRARVRARDSSNMAAANKGYVRHPAPRNNRDSWSSTKVHTEGWWDKVADKQAPKVTADFRKALDKYADLLAAKIKSGTG